MTDIIYGKYWLDVDTIANCKPLFTSADLRDDRKYKNDLEVAFETDDGEVGVKYIERRMLKNITKMIFRIRHEE